MKLRHIPLLLLAVALPPAGIALATAPDGVEIQPHVGAAQLGEVRANADGVKLQTKGPTDVSVLTLTVEPGGTTGWHSHPGVAVISVVEGTGRLYFADCSSRTYGAGTAFVETGKDDQTVFRNEGTEPVVLTVTFFAPEGEGVLEDREDPGCGVA